MTKTATTAPPLFEDHEGMNRNTDLCVDLKTFLRYDRIALLGKEYEGSWKNYCIEAAREILFLTSLVEDGSLKART